MSTTTSAIESVLAPFCMQKIEQAAVINPRYAALWQEIHYYLMAGGKRMRPRLVLLAYDAYKTADEFDITHVAAAWELLHACLLVHDDIIDRDTMRHGQPNIAGRYQAVYGKGNEHYALSAALLSGDLLLMSAYEIIDTAPIDSDAKLLAYSYLNKALFTVAGGELIDTDAVLYPVTDSNPHAVAAYKTASYSLQLPLQCGAALAGAPKEELEKLSEIGLHAGIAYQLRDDLLGVFGDSKTTGKSNRSDIFEKKRTALIHETLSRLSADDAASLQTLLSPEHTVTNKEAEHIVRLIVSSGAKEATRQVVIRESQQALRVIDTLSAYASSKHTLSQIVHALTDRTS